jgi:SAM-dependent methyltransferase
MDDETAFDNWQHGDAYERYIGRWSRRVAPGFLSWLDAEPGLRWVDVGCGTGALSEAILARCSPASVVGVEPSDGFRLNAERRLGTRATILGGTAESLPLPDNSADVLVSGLVLNFVPDAPAAVAELSRVAADGATIAAYVWDYGGDMQLIRYFWEAAAELDSTGAVLDEAVRFPLCRPEALRDLFSAGGLGSVDVQAIDIQTPFEHFEDYWRPFLGGQGSAPGYLMSLEEPARQQLKELLRQRVPSRPDGSISLVARAWAVRGRAK